MASSKDRSAADNRHDGGTAKVCVITCAVLEDEVGHFARQLPNIRHIEILQQGLHNEPDRLRRELQEAVDRVEHQFPEADTIVLGYGLCSRGVEGVRSRRCRLVIARAHDCITHLLGSKERYRQYVAEHPGTYWYSPGWNRHHVPPGPERYKQLFRQYAEKYGEDNARYLMEMEQHWFTTYDRATFVDLGLTDVTEDEQYTRRCAEWLGWSFDRQCGDPRLVHDLLAGPWDEERFLVLQPGQTVRLTGDDRIVEAVSADTLEVVAADDVGSRSSATAPNSPQADPENASHNAVEEEQETPNG
ncbi:MAG: DUF1638 domain-containing protein [Planctomycetes bacterium]|nr:DUF1638 domain-containing protein [Planctomycetota bacterium]